MLSTIDLLEHGFGPGGKQTPFDPKGLEAIRHQAEILVHKLAPGLNSPMKMWLPRVDFSTGRGVEEDLWGDTAISPARAGTNILEYGRLSELSRDLVYFRNVISKNTQKNQKKYPPLIFHSFSSWFSFFCPQLDPPNSVIPELLAPNSVTPKLFDPNSVAPKFTPPISHIDFFAG